MKRMLIFAISSLIFLIIVLNFILLGKLSAQAKNPIQAPTDADTWALRLGGSMGDGFGDGIETSDGSYVAVGYTASFNAGNLDLWVVKLNPDGSVVWQKTYGDDLNEYANSIVETSDGGYVIAGARVDFLTSDRDAWILKLDSEGVIQWQKSFETDAYPQKVIETQDGSLMIAGYIGSVGAATGWVMKLDANGELLWQKGYGESYFLEFHDIQEMANGDMLFVGRTESFGAGYLDAWVLKLNADGNIAWQKTFGGSSYDDAVAVELLSDGNLVVAGRTYSFGAGGADAWVLKLDPDGNILAQKTIGTADKHEYVRDVTQMEDGSLVLAGYVGADAWVLKLDPDWNIVWQRSFGGSNYDYFHSVQETSDQGLLITGETKSSLGTAMTSANTFAVREIEAVTTPYPGNLFDAWVLKLDASGGIDSCSLMADTNAVVMDSTANVTDTSITPQDLTPAATDTAVTPQDSASVEDVLCQAFLTPTPTWTGTATRTGTPTNTATPTSTPTLNCDLITSQDGAFIVMSNTLHFYITNQNPGPVNLTYTSLTWEDYYDPAMYVDYFSLGGVQYFTINDYSSPTEVDTTGATLSLPGGLLSHWTGQFGGYGSLYGFTHTIGPFAIDMIFDGQCSLHAEIPPVVAWVIHPDENEMISDITQTTFELGASDIGVGTTNGDGIGLIHYVVLDSSGNRITSNAATDSNLPYCVWDDQGACAQMPLSLWNSLPNGAYTLLAWGRSSETLSWSAPTQVTFYLNRDLPTPTPTVTPTGTKTPTNTLTPTSTHTPTTSPIYTGTVTHTPTPTPTVTDTPSITPTFTDTPTITPSVTNTSAPTPSVTHTSTPVPTPSYTPTPTPTQTFTPTPSHTPTAIPTRTSTPTSTLTPTPFSPPPVYHLYLPLLRRP